ncbi:hypothetical protein C8F01DRAFT_191851 [Mycena amicta]|nr:hypothetical protein C8F01DRAFT_191851 [Mycena amicta]
MTRLSNDNAPIVIGFLRQRPHHLGRVPGRRVPPSNHSADSELEIPSAIPNPLDIPVVDLFPRQSRTAEEATARYTLKTGRAPQPNFDRWFQFIGQGQISSTSTPPFRAVLPAGQGHFREMDSGHKMTLDHSRGLTTIGVRHGDTGLRRDGAADDQSQFAHVGLHGQLASPSIPKTPTTARKDAMLLKDPVSNSEGHFPDAGWVRPFIYVHWIGEGPDCREFRLIAAFEHVLRSFSPLLELQLQLHRRPVAGYYLASLLQHHVPWRLLLR